MMFISSNLKFDLKEFYDLKKILEVDLDWHKNCKTDLVLNDYGEKNQDQ